MNITSQTEFVNSNSLDRKYFIYSKGLTISDLAIKHRVSIAAISRAIKGEQPMKGLLKRISKAKYLGLPK